jgi:rhodanese-related sulfurtransferase
MLKIRTLFILIFSVFSLTVFASETVQISQQELITTLSENNAQVVLLDVRSAKEYNEGHIDGAINISYDNIADNLSKLEKYKNSTVVVYCRSGRRAGIAEELLSKNGFKNLRHLTGDMNGWLEAKRPVVQNNY